MFYGISFRTDAVKKSEHSLTHLCNKFVVYIVYLNLTNLKYSNYFILY